MERQDRPGGDPVGCVWMAGVCDSGDLRVGAGRRVGHRRSGRAIVAVVGRGPDAGFDRGTGMVGIAGMVGVSLRLQAGPSADRDGWTCLFVGGDRNRRWKSTSRAESVGGGTGDFRRNWKRGGNVAVVAMQRTRAGPGQCRDVGTCFRHSFGVGVDPLAHIRADLKANARQTDDAARTETHGSAGDRNPYSLL